MPMQTWQSKNNHIVGTIFIAHTIQFHKLLHYFYKSLICRVAQSVISVTARSQLTSSSSASFAPPSDLLGYSGFTKLEFTPLSHLNSIINYVEMHQSLGSFAMTVCEKNTDFRIIKQVMLYLYNLMAINLREVISFHLASVVVCKIEIIKIRPRFRGAQNLHYLGDPPKEK